MQPPRPAATYRYWACDLRTGGKLAELPLKPSGPLPERISDVSTAAFTCDQAALPKGADFDGYTTPGRTVIVVEREYEGDNTSDILWAGIVTNRVGGDIADATLNCATPAAYYGRRQVGTRTYLGTGGDTDTKVITDLLTDAAPEGIPLTLDVACPQLRAVRYLDRERRTVLACLKDLADMDGGPEWTVTTRWTTTARQAISFVFQARPRLGWAGAPNARFDYPGSIRTYTVTDDFTEGHGANHIIGINNNGAAGSTPARDNTALGQGWPRWEEVVQKSGELNTLDLAGVAKAALTKRARGQSTTDLAVDATLAPQLGRDWFIGDNIAFIVYGPDAPGAPPPSFKHPAGRSETIRVIGYALDIPGDTFTPVVWNPYDGTVTG
jgi:hypothetical protein